jgi:aryl-alcohol dehydrogenase-like predicted oxidoreductase
VAYLEENLAAAEVSLSDHEVQQIGDAIGSASGERYDPQGMRSVNL